MKTIFQGGQIFDKFQMSHFFLFDNFQFIVGEASHLQKVKSQNHYLSFYFQVQVVMPAA